MSTARPIRLDDLAAIIAELHRDITWLAAPCGCPNNLCRTMAEHMHRLTSEGRRGIPAAGLEPSRSSAIASIGLPTHDPADAAHSDYLTAVAALKAAGDRLATAIDSWRPDRLKADTADPDIWCRHHLDTIASCEPRYRGDQCRFCYDFLAVNKVPPSAEILAARHRGERITATMVDQLRRDTRAARKRRKRRK